MKQELEQASEYVSDLLERKEAVEYERDELVRENNELKQENNSLHEQVDYYIANVKAFYRSAKDYLQDEFKVLKNWIRMEVESEGYESGLNRMEKNKKRNINRNHDLDR